MEATCVHKLKHDVRDPAGRVDIVPDLVEDSLISGPKFAEAGYVTLLTPKELLIFDGQDLKLRCQKMQSSKGGGTQAAEACGAYL